MLPQTVTTPIRVLHTHLLVFQLRVPRPPLGHLRAQLPLLDLLYLRLKHDIVDVIPDEIRNT